MELSEAAQERLIKVCNVGKTVFYYGIIPYIIFKGLNTPGDPDFPPTIFSLVF